MTDVLNAQPANTNEMPQPPVEAPVQDTVAEQVPNEQTPAQPVQQAPEPQEAQPEVTPVSYTPTGNAALDAAAQIVADGGFDPLSLSQEIRDGGLKPETRAALEAKLGKAQVDILHATYNTEISKMQSAAEAQITAVYETVGGKDFWNKIAEWTATPEAGLSDEAADAYNDMLAAGGVQAQLAARALKEAYMSSPGFKQDNPIMQQPTSNVPASVNIEPISRPQYTAERKKAVREGNAALVQQLDARARHTMERVPNQWRINAVIN